MGGCISKHDQHYYRDDTSPMDHHQTGGTSHGSSQMNTTVCISPARAAYNEKGTALTASVFQGRFLQHDEIDDSPFITHLRAYCTTGLLAQDDKEPDDEGGDDGENVNEIEKQPQQPQNSRIALAAWTEGSVTMHDIDSKELIAHVTASRKTVNKIAYSPSSNVLATASRDATAHFWKLDAADAHQELSCSKRPLKQFNSLFQGEHGMTVSAVDLSSSGARAVSGSRDTSLKVWDIEQQMTISQLKNKPRNIVTCLKWFPHTTNDDTSQQEPNLFAQGSEDLQVRIWDCRTRIVTEALSLSGYVYFPLDVDISSDGTYVVTSSKGFDTGGCEIKLWDLRFPSTAVQEKPPRTKCGYSKRGSFHGHSKDVVSCCFFGHGETPKICSAAKDSTIRVWDPNSQPKCIIQHVESGINGFSSMCSVSGSDSPTGETNLLASTFQGGILHYRIDIDQKSLLKET